MTEDKANPLVDDIKKLSPEPGDVLVFKATPPPDPDYVRDAMRLIGLDGEVVCVLLAEDDDVDLVKNDAIRTALQQAFGEEE